MRGAEFTIVLVAAVGVLLGGCSGSRWLNGRWPQDRTQAGETAPASPSVEIDSIQVELGRTQSTGKDRPSDPSALLAAEPPHPGTASAAVPGDSESGNPAWMLNLLHRLESMEHLSPREYAELKRAFEAPAPALPLLYQQQLLAMSQYLERKAMSAPATGARAEFSDQPATAPTGQSSRRPAEQRPQPVDAGRGSSDGPDALFMDGERPLRPGQRDSQGLPALDDGPATPLQPDEGTRALADIHDDRQADDHEAAVNPTHANHHSSQNSSPSAVAEGAARSQGRDQSVVAVSHQEAAQEKLRPGAWKEHLARAAEALEAELRDAAGSQADRPRFEAYQRLLYVIADRRKEAVRPIDQLEEAEQEFWKSQLHSLLISLDAEGMPVASRRSALALRHLREAADHLASVSTLDLRNLAFCSQVDGFGGYNEFPKYEFRPDQEVLLYVEVDNFTVEQKSLTFETELQGGYQIFDSAGRRVADQVLPFDKQVCRNRRRDYFIAYRIYMPKRIYPGEYTLQLTIEDVKGQKFGQGSIDFAIKN